MTVWLCVCMCVAVHVCAHTLWILLSASLTCKGNTADCNVTSLLGDFFLHDVSESFWTLFLYVLTHLTTIYWVPTLSPKSKALTTTENVQPSSWRLFSNPQTLWIGCSGDKCRPVQRSLPQACRKSERHEGPTACRNNDLLSIDTGLGPGRRRTLRNELEKSGGTGCK